MESDGCCVHEVAVYNKLGWRGIERGTLLGKVNVCVQENQLGHWAVKFEALFGFRLSEIDRSSRTTE